MTSSATDQQSTPPLAVIVLAAGQGTRMRSRLPKPLHRAGGRPLIDHVLRAGAALRPAQTIVVTGHGADEVRAHLEESADASPGAPTGRLATVHQAEQLGTAHAVMVALPALDPDIATAVVLYGDTPLLTEETLVELVAARAAEGVPVAFVTCLAPDPAGYGRILRDAANRVTGIVEDRVATPAQRRIAEINGGVYAFDAAWLRTALPRIQVSPRGEYYLTDLVGLASAEAGDGAWPVATAAADISEALGVNDRVQLAEAEARLRARTARRLMLAGVTLIDPATTFIDDTVEIGQDTIIYPFTTITGATTIGADCRIGPHATIDACTISDGCRVLASTLEGSTMEAGSDIGPYSHLRPGAHLGPGVHVGNFGEIKNAYIGAGTLIGHVSYIGDATLGERVNIGAGAITANYDGRRKNRTIIGDDAFIGCDTILRAPVEVSPGAATGAGAVVTRDVPPGTIAVGIPARPLKRREPAEESASTSDT